MKKMMWLGVLLVGAVGMASAQESRQDISASFIGTMSPQVYGLGVEPMTTTHTGGFLGSYRYLLTPRSGLELNYSWAQYSVKYNLATALVPNSSQVHARQQEISGAYVYSRSYRNYNPFVEAGVGGMIFTPILDNGTKVLDTKQNTNVGALFGGGLAYEVSPSFDVRIEYRGFLCKAPDFGIASFKSSRYYVVSTPSLGIAYHF
jgi:opacity protein-like surface antigen